MRYRDALLFVWRSPNGWTNLVIGFVCAFVPVAGPIVFIGYLFEIIDTLHWRRTDAAYPDFDVNRLGKYFMRGAWPFVTMLLLGLVPWLFFFALGWGCLAAVVAMTQGFTVKPEPWPLGLLVGGATLGCWLFAVAFQVLASPTYLRSGLTQAFGGFSWRFVRGYLARVGGAELKVAIFLSVVFVPLTLLSIACFVVPFHFVWSWLLFVQHHFHYQLYELYLRRGGEPLPAPPPEVEAVPADYASEDDARFPEALPG
jgi:hypothetical protein